MSGVYLVTLVFADLLATCFANLSSAHASPYCIHPLVKPAQKDCCFGVNLVTILLGEINVGINAIVVTIDSFMLLLTLSPTTSFTILCSTLECPVLEASLFKVSYAAIGASVLAICDVTYGLLTPEAIIVGMPATIAVVAMLLFRIALCCANSVPFWLDLSSDFHILYISLLSIML